ncbi:MAG: inositol monophosphatase [Bacteroidales bacterium]|nr:inositol monophosphatase [Bacteroidales bacterium]
MNLEYICKQVVELTNEVGKFINHELNSKLKIETKGRHDFVTHVDKTSEKKIVDKLSELIPESGFIAEEGTSTKRGDVYNWIIDPLDGTTNFIHGLSPFSISIALQRNNETVLGVVHELGLDECFYSWEGSPAYLNGREISVSSGKTIEESLIATGFPYQDYKRIKPFMETLEFFMHNSQGVRRIGSAATDLVYVACGRFEAFYEYSLNPWDVAAGAFIVQQAGGKVCDFRGDSNYLFGKEIVASNPYVFDSFLQNINKIMNK